MTGGRFLIVALALALAAGRAQAGDATSDFKKSCPNTAYKSYFFAEGLSVEVEIPLDRLEASPPYNAEEEPPLTPGEAVRLAKVELRLAVADEDDWDFANMSLVLVCARRAYYEVTWQRYARGQNSLITIPVLLSGEALSTAAAIKEARARVSRGSGLR
jgi:hypothetical protein